jgi:hypothetical protein
MDERLVSQIEAATAECMRDRGMSYELSEAPALPPLPKDYEFDPAMNESFVSQYGYGIAIPSPLNGGVQPQQASAPAEPVDDPDAYAVALYDGSSGCRPRAEAAILGDAGKPVSASYFNESERRAYESASLQPALLRWRECMAEVGYSFASPRAARLWIGGRMEAIAKGGSPSAAAVRALADEERPLADADWKCYVSELRTALKAALRAEEQKMIAADEVLRTVVAANLKILGSHQ